MTKKLLLLLLMINSISNHCIGQVTNKTNPIIFGELILGYGGEFGQYGGFLYGGTANVQFKENLFTVRYIQHPEFKYKPIAIGTVGIPTFESKFNNTEIAVLYGKRYVEDGMSYSYAAGLSTNNYHSKYRDGEDQISKLETQHYGFAYELNIKWFNADKKRYRIYMVVPVGKPTSFGRSFGFKLVGNVSEHSYVGVAMTYGFGWHKYY